MGAVGSGNYAGGEGGRVQANPRLAESITNPLSWRSRVSVGYLIPHRTIIKSSVDGSSVEGGGAGHAGVGS